MHIRAQQLRGAIGDRDCDFIELRNAFAKVQIQRLTQLTDGTGGAELVVTGDTLYGPRGFTDATLAYGYALNSLAAYVAGRGD
jgi:hypothetical protein